MIFRFTQWLKDIWQGQSYGGVPRSSQWPRVRADYLKLHPVCEVCGKKKSLLKQLEVHHCIPFYLRQDLELSNDNLICLCRPHHYLVGHLMDWKSWSESVKIDSDIWRLKIKNRKYVK
jgi:hypothetical protein